MEDPKLALSAPDSLVQKLTAIAEKWYLIHTRNIRSELATYKQQSPSLAETERPVWRRRQAGKEAGETTG